MALTRVTGLMRAGRRSGKALIPGSLRRSPKSTSAHQNLATVGARQRMALGQVHWPFVPQLLDAAAWPYHAAAGSRSHLGQDSASCEWTEFGE